MRRVLVVVFLGLVIASAVYYWVALRPWLVGPDEPAGVIEQRWRWVQEQAVMAPACSGDALQLEAAIQGIAEDWNDAEGEIIDEEDGSVRLLRFDDLPSRVRMRIQLLIAWHVADGGLGEGVGTWHRLDVLALHRLGQMVAASLGGGSDYGQLGALLSLSRRLYECGALVEAALGLRLQELARETAGRIELDIRTFARWVPSAAGIFAALAREAVSSVTYVESVMAEEGWTQGGDTGAPGPALWLVSPERELALLRQFLGSQLQAAYPHRDTPHDMAPLLAIPYQHDLPKSHLVRIVAAGYNHIVETMATQIDQYRVFVGRD